MSKHLLAMVSRVGDAMWKSVLFPERTKRSAEKTIGSKTALKLKPFQAVTAKQLRRK
jgi:hypothetical protein